MRTADTGYEDSSSAGELFCGQVVQDPFVEGGERVELSWGWQVNEVPAGVFHVRGRRVLDGGAAGRQQADQTATKFVAAWTQCRNSNRSELTMPIFGVAVGETLHVDHPSCGDLSSRIRTIAGDRRHVGQHVHVSCPFRAG